MGAALAIGRRAQGFSEKDAESASGHPSCTCKESREACVEQVAAFSRKAKQRMQRTSGPDGLRDPEGHRPRGTAPSVIIPLVAGAIPACESSLVPFE